MKHVTEHDPCDYLWEVGSFGVGEGEEGKVIITVKCPGNMHQCTDAHLHKLPFTPALGYLIGKSSSYLTVSNLCLLIWPQDVLDSA